MMKTIQSKQFPQLVIYARIAFLKSITWNDYNKNVAKLKITLKLHILISSASFIKYTMPKMFNPYLNHETITMLS